MRSELNSQPLLQESSRKRARGLLSVMSVLRSVPESGLDTHLMGALLLRRKKRLTFLNFVILLIKLIEKETSLGGKEIPLVHVFS